MRIGKYQPKITPELIALVEVELSKAKGPISTRQIQQSIVEHINAEVSLTTIRRLLRIHFRMKYKKIYRKELRCNFLEQK